MLQCGHFDENLCISPIVSRAKNSNEGFSRALDQLWMEFRSTWQCLAATENLSSTDSTAIFSPSNLECNKQTISLFFFHSFFFSKCHPFAKPTIGSFVNLQNEFTGFGKCFHPVHQVRLWYSFDINLASTASIFFSP